jgi:hypothetical protein
MLTASCLKLKTKARLYSVFSLSLWEIAVVHGLYAFSKSQKQTNMLDNSISQNYMLYDDILMLVLCHFIVNAMLWHYNIDVVAL